MKEIKTSLKAISSAIKRTIDILDRAGYVMYSSDNARVGSLVESFDSTCSVPLNKSRSLFIHGEGIDKEASQLIQLILKDATPEELVDNSQQFLINIMDGYSYSEKDCKRFNLPYHGSYIVYCIGLFSDEHFSDALNLISNSFYDNGSFFVFPFGNNIILLEKANSFTDNIKVNAETIKDVINSELFEDVWIGIGNIHSGIMNIPMSYNEAMESARIGKLFNIPKDIYIFKDILIERMISQIPADKVEELVSEIFPPNIDQLLDEELVRTAQVMFQNNLNISDTSKILYIHRNTLLYRLDKIQKSTGLDIRKFGDAVIFKLGLLLKSIIKD